MHPYLFELASLMAIFVFAIVSPRRRSRHGHPAIAAAWPPRGDHHELRHWRRPLMMHVTYTVLGLGLIISKSIYLFNIVKWCGVAYLVYIGIKALRAGTTKIDVDATPKEPRKQQSFAKAFGLGFAANALNPKAVFFFLSIFLDGRSCPYADRGEARLRCRNGDCAHLWFCRRQSFHDDAEDASGLRARLEMD